MTDTTTSSPLRQRMIEDMTARKTRAGLHREPPPRLQAVRRLAAALARYGHGRRPPQFQLHLTETGVGHHAQSHHDGLALPVPRDAAPARSAPEIYHIKEPQKVPLILNQDEAKRLLAMADTLRNRLLLSLGYGAGLRAGEVVRLKVKHIDSAQMIIHVEQSKGRKDRLVMLSPETLALLRQWWKVRSNKHDRGVPVQERWLFPGRRKGRL